MSTRTRERAAARAEARRRARLAARGELPDADPDPEDGSAAATESRGGLLRRLFPPAPPLPGLPDPLDGFEPTGSMRPVRERLFLLRQNPWAWTLPGLLSFIGYSASQFYRGGLLGVVGTFVQFGALIGAGWFGWQRPTLYGGAAGFVSFVAAAVLVIYGFAAIGAGPEEIGFDVVATNVAFAAVFLTALGFLGGWYGGYLRRRQAQLGSEARRRR